MKTLTLTVEIQVPDDKLDNADVLYAAVSDMIGETIQDNDGNDYDVEVFW